MLVPREGLPAPSPRVPSHPLLPQLDFRAIDLDGLRVRAGSCPVLTQVSRPATTSHCGSHWRAAGPGESLSCVDGVASPGHGSPVDRPEEFEAHYFFVTRVGH